MLVAEQRQHLLAHFTFQFRVESTSMFVMNDGKDLS